MKHFYNSVSFSPLLKTVNFIESYYRIDKQYFTFTFELWTMSKSPFIKINFLLLVTMVIWIYFNMNRKKNVVLYCTRAKSNFQIFCCWTARDNNCYRICLENYSLFSVYCFQCDFVVRRRIVLAYNRFCLLKPWSFIGSH